MASTKTKPEKRNRKDGSDTRPAEPSGFVDLLGQEIMLVCTHYEYVGTLARIGRDFIELVNGRLMSKAGEMRPAMSQIQLVMPWRIMFSAIESFGLTQIPPEMMQQRQPPQPPQQPMQPPQPPQPVEQVAASHEQIAAAGVES